MARKKFYQQPDEVAWWASGVRDFAADGSLRTLSQPSTTNKGALIREFDPDSGKRRRHIQDMQVERRLCLRVLRKVVG